MTRLHSIVIVVPKNVHEGKITTIDPSSTLDHELFMGFHGISIGDCIRDVLERVFAVLLAVDSKGEDSVFGEVHVCLPVVFLFVAWV